jgi:hypothetical protein
VSFVTTPFFFFPPHRSVCLEPVEYEKAGNYSSFRRLSKQESRDGMTVAVFGFVTRTASQQTPV